MNQIVKMKDLTAFLDRKLPLAGLEIIRTVRNGPIIFKEEYFTSDEVQVALREALKMLVYFAPNYGVDKGNLEPVKALSKKSFKSYCSDNDSQYLAWQRARILWGGWYDKDRMRQNDPLIYDILFNGDGHADEYEGAVAQARAHYWCNDEKQCRAPRYNPSEIYNDYLAWCNGDGLTPWKSGTFLKKFKTDALDKGCVFKKTGADGRHWRGFDFIDGRPKDPKHVMI